MVKDAVSLENRLCLCGCGTYFECPATSRRRFLQGHASKTVEWKNTERLRRVGVKRPGVGKGKKLSVEAIRKRTATRYNNAKIRGSYFSADALCRMRETANRPDVLVRRSELSKEMWTNDEYRLRVYKGQSFKPNGPESILIQLLNDHHPGVFSYVGNRKFWIDRFNPDFIDRDNKIIIEYDGKHWHGDTVESVHDVERNLAYSSAGYRLLILRDGDIVNKEVVLNKLAAIMMLV